MEDKKSAKFVVGGVYSRKQGDETLYGLLSGATVSGVGRRIGSIRPEGHVEERVIEGALGPWELVGEPVSPDLLDRLEKAALELPAALETLERLKADVAGLLRGAGVAERLELDPLGSTSSRLKG